MFGNKMDKIAKLADKNDALKLLGMLNDKDEKVVLAAIDALGRCNGDDAFNALVPLVHNDNADVRTHAVLALGKMGLPKARTFLLHPAGSRKEPRSARSHGHRPQRAGCQAVTVFPTKAACRSGAWLLLRFRLKTFKKL